MNTLLSRAFPGRLLALTAVVVMIGVGCSDNAAKKLTINGTVSHKGQPMRSGMLTLVGPQGNYSAMIQADGSYTITDVVPGEVKVGVMPTPKGSKSASSEDEKDDKAEPASLPEKFRNPETSELKYTITAETKNLPIKIE